MPDDSASTVPGFLPSTGGLHFANAWPAGTPALIVDTPLGRLPLGDASRGLCGGMVFAAADLFDRGRPPPPDRTPPTEPERVNFLTRRLLTSWDLPTGALRYALWMSSTDHDSLWGTKPGVRTMTAQALPRIVATLDDGRLCPLGVVTVRSVNPADLGHNHQVLAYGYERPPASAGEPGATRLHVYDPNRPDDDGIVIEVPDDLEADPPSGNLGLDRPIRGLFAVDYAPVDPEPLLGG